ncbi:galactose-3-O-sulfotransferase 2-like [Branchiostoma lanceolatum]|uniref:galactose-3-O-sulfotransferase 2-like n=1 Tax=Branchiostoma lanceolatum TaxID=7740 RepID=UPI003452E0A6
MEGTGQAGVPRKLCKFFVVVIFITVGLCYLLVTVFDYNSPLPFKPSSHKMPNRGLFGGHDKEVCDKKLNYMFVKVHKAGSTTTTCILQRFAYENDLTVALPMKGYANIGWPHFFKREDIIPSADGTFNVLVDHVVYHKELLHHILPADTVYFATLRHPLSHLKSVLNWYHLTTRFHGLDREHPLRSFLENPTKFEIPYLTNSNSPFSYTKNYMAFDLGFPIGLSDSKSAVDEFVSRLSKDIHLVLILEYYNESLVLLRRLMCWKLKDVLYDLQPKNIRTYNKSSENFTRLVAMHRQWSNVDYKLYDYFNATLWDKIKQEGGDFHQEVDHFQNVLQSTATYCAEATQDKHEINSTGTKLTIPVSAWNDEFDIDPHFCFKLKMHRWDWDFVFRKKQELPSNMSNAVKESIHSPGLRVLNEYLVREIFNII